MDAEHAIESVAAVSALELALRLGLALVFGALIGIEREWHHKAAGIRTHALLSLGSAAFGVISLLGFGPTNNPMQIAAGVLTGIGFIGGGVIMRRGDMVQGITTATTLWTTASIGLAVAAGYYVLTTLVFLGVLAVQFPLRALSHWVEQRAGTDSPRQTFCLEVRAAPAAEEAVRTAWAALAGHQDTTVTADEGGNDGREAWLRAEFTLPADRAGEVLALNRTLAEQSGVKSARLVCLTGAQTSAASG